MSYSALRLVAPVVLTAMRPNDPSCGQWVGRLTVVLRNGPSRRPPTPVQGFRWWCWHRDVRTLGAQRPDRAPPCWAKLAPPSSPLAWCRYRMELRQRCGV